MTKIVTKGTNRAGHSARTAKAAQRTPLPPKGATSAPSKADTAEIIKEELAKVKSKKADKPAKEERVVPRTMPALLADAQNGGWTADTTFPDTSIIQLVFKRGDEELTVVYHDLTIISSDVPTYVVGSRQIKLRNVSAARKQLLVPADEATAVRVRAPRNTDNGKLPADRPRRRIPFDVDTATEEEIKVAVAGRRIKWRNTLTGGYDQGFVGKEPKQLKVETHPKTNKRMLTFCDTKGGFRTVLLERLLTVSK